jgi:hypothetical protein
VKLTINLSRICIAFPAIALTLLPFSNLSAFAMEVDNRQKVVETRSLISTKKIAQSSGEDSQEQTITPFSLVSLAEEGRFKDQGIPGFNELRTSYKEGEVTAESLVKVAIDNNLISPQSLQDKEYLDGVRLQLRDRLK